MKRPRRMCHIWMCRGRPMPLSLPCLTDERSTVWKARESSAPKSMIWELTNTQKRKAAMAPRDPKTTSKLAKFST